MGRAKPEALTEDGSRAFSLDTFLTRWETMSPRAKATWFDRPTRAVLNDVATIARGSKAAMGYANRSNTAGGVAGQMLLTGSVGAIGGFPLLLKATVAQYVTGKVLAAPGFARWVASAPKAGTQAANKAWIGRLRVVAAREPAIAKDVTQIQAALNASLLTRGTSAAEVGRLPGMLNDNVGVSAAASPGNAQEDQRK